MNKRIVSADLYCGMGGATQGMIDAGADVVLSVDCWDVAEKMHRANFPSVPFVLHKLGEDDDADFELVESAFKSNVAEDVHFHVHGSPPCQALSAAKGTHYPEKIKKAMRFVHAFIRLVDRLKKVGLCHSWSMENVPPIKNHLPKSFPHQMLMASDYGAPQNRYRYFGGEGWVAQKTGGALPWNKVIESDGLPDDALLNMGGAGESPCLRNTLCDRPLDTVANTCTSQHPTIRAPDGDSFRKIRQITLHEKALLMGFPDTVVLPDDINRTDLNQALGNAVCPQVMVAIIKGLRGSLLWL